jgi:hypothetical protein
VNFLHRIYHELRNLGVLPQERALNYAATNAFNAREVFAIAVRDEMELDTIKVGRSPLCRPGSDCWEVEIYLFDPSSPAGAPRKVHRYTVDVSDVVPVTIGPIHSWSTR